MQLSDGLTFYWPLYDNHPDTLNLIGSCSTTNTLLVTLYIQNEYFETR